MLKITKIRKVIHKGMGTLRSWPAATKGVLKKVFLKISQNSQENNCARVSILINLQASGLQLY